MYFVSRQMRALTFFLQSDAVGRIERACLHLHSRYRNCFWITRGSARLNFEGFIPRHPGPDKIKRSGFEAGCPLLFTLRDSFNGDSSAIDPYRSTPFHSGDKLGKLGIPGPVRVPFFDKRVFPLFGFLAQVI